MIMKLTNRVAQNVGITKAFATVKRGNSKTTNNSGLYNSIRLGIGSVPSLIISAVESVWGGSCLGVHRGQSPLAYLEPIDKGYKTFGGYL